MPKEMSQSKPDDKTPEKPEKESVDTASSKPIGPGVFEWLVIGFLAVCFLSIRFNLIVVFFPAIAVPVLLLNYFIRRVSFNTLGMILLAFLICMNLAPIDIAFRPGPRNEIKFLPIMQCHGAMGHVRKAIDEGKRENVDFIVASTGCCGPKFAEHAVVFFRESEYTSSFGSNVTHDEADERIRDILQFMKMSRELENKRNEKTP